MELGRGGNPPRTINKGEYGMMEFRLDDLLAADGLQLAKDHPEYERLAAMTVPKNKGADWLFSKYEGPISYAELLNLGNAVEDKEYE